MQSAPNSEGEGHFAFSKLATLIGVVADRLYGGVELLDSFIKMICTPKVRHFWGAYHTWGIFIFSTGKRKRITSLWRNPWGSRLPRAERCV